MIRDGLMVFGAVAVLTGLWWIWPPLCLILGGIGMMSVSWLMGERG